MTIAIGFRFDSGVLLCADSQYTQGLAKLQGKKIFTPDIGWGKAVFAIAGAVPYAKSAINLCAAGLRELPKKKRAKESLRRSLESMLNEFYKQQIYPHPDRGKFEGPDFELLIAIWSELDGLVFFSTSETTVTEVGKYHVMGIGRDLAHFLLAGMFHHDHMPVRDIANIGIHVLRETKEWVEYCGGESQFAVLCSDGTIRRIEYKQIKDAETISKSFREAVRRLYVCAADLSMTEERMKDEMEIVMVLLQSAREERQREIPKWDLVLSTLTAQVRREHK